MCYKKRRRLDLLCALVVWVEGMNGGHCRGQWFIIPPFLYLLYYYCLNFCFFTTSASFCWTQQTFFSSLCPYSWPLEVWRDCTAKSIYCIAFNQFSRVGPNMFLQALGICCYNQTNACILIPKVPLKTITSEVLLRHLSGQISFYFYQLHIHQNTSSSGLHLRHRVLA